MAYQLYLNDRLYGKGDLKYMQELIDDWIAARMWGQQQAVFRIERCQ